VTQSKKLLTFEWAGPIAIINIPFGGDMRRQLRLDKGAPLPVLALPLPLTKLGVNECLLRSSGPNTVGEVTAIEWSPFVLTGRGTINLDPEAAWAQPLLRGERQYVEGHVHPDKVVRVNERWWHGVARTIGMRVPDLVAVATSWELHHVNLTPPPATDLTDPRTRACFIALTDPPAGAAD
jgi:hypothetical protein